MRVAVFDAYWSTAGGGETYAAGVAEVLSGAHDVTLLAHEAVDTAWLGERLGADLSRVVVEVIEPTWPLEVVSAGFDLLINLSYRDRGRCGADHGIYVVHFPDRPETDWSRWQRALNRAGRPLQGNRPPIRVVQGFHRPDAVRWQEARWTDGLGVLAVELPPGRHDTLHLWFGRFVPGGVSRRISVSVEGEVVETADLVAPRSKLEVIEPVRIDVPVAGRQGGTTVEISSDSVVADDVIGNGDRRRLGVPLVGVGLGRSARASIAARASLLFADPPGTGWLDSYDVVVANSAFTQRWIRRWWGVESQVLEPPVRRRSPGAKAPVILSVGRFFAPGRGHAKKQLEMVAAFGELCADGTADGWELHLVGGCNPVDAAYLDQVRAAAAGLPVVVHVDATGAELDRLYQQASIYWHATGLGEDVDADPVRAEHFGITTVEAMSAEAVPVVMAAGGQTDIVRSGVDGLVFTSLDGLVGATRGLLLDPAERKRLGRASRVRSEQFGFESFATRLVDLVDAVSERRPGPEGRAD